MKKKIFSIIIFASLFCLASFALAQNQITIENPLGETSTFSGLLLKIASGVGALIASLGTLMIIISGVLYVTSAGDPQGVNRAKTALSYAVIGIVVGLAAEGIITLIKTIIGAA